MKTLGKGPLLIPAETISAASAMPQARADQPEQTNKSLSPENP